MSLRTARTVVPAAIVLSFSWLTIASDSQIECTLEVKHFESPRAKWTRISSQTERVYAARAALERWRPVRPDAPETPVQNFIDEEIFATMQKGGIKPTRLTTDEEFIRRVTLAVAGSLPTSGEVRSFLNDTDPGKRNALVDVLLVSEGFTDRWTLWFGDLVQNVRFATNTRLYVEGRNAYYEWIQQSIASGVPYDVMIRELIAGSGDAYVAGPANYIVRQLQPNGPAQDTYDNLAASSFQKFMGMPFECISCHSGPGHLELVNSYLSTRERPEFWQNAAFFARASVRGSRQDDNSVRFTVGERERGEYLLNTSTGNKSPREPIPGESEIVDPRFLFGGGPPLPGETRRQAFGRLLTADRQFARATVNYIWKELFHLGIVEPVDSFDISRLDPDNLQPGAVLQPTHPVLLERLTDAFIDSSYDLRSLIRLIVTSSAYQFASVYTPGEWDEAWTPYFARHYAERLGAEVLLDAVTTATGIPASYRVEGFGTLERAIKLPDPTESGGRRNPHGRMLDAFGRGDRDDNPRTNEGSILQALHLLNDELVTIRVKASTPGSTVGRAIRSGDENGIIDEIYLATLSRYPTEAERQLVVDALSTGAPVQVIEDLQFSLLNKLEFMFN